MAPQALDIEGAVESQKKSMAVDDDGRPARTGNEWTALAHLVTAVSGAGVLSLAWSMSQIGWVAGSIILVLLALATLYSSSLLSDCYRHPDPAAGARNHTYTKCVNAILGKRQAWFCALAQYADLYGATVAFTIVASSSIAAIAQSVCYRKHGKNTPCDAVTGRYTLIFGGIQIFFSQLQDMQRVRWLSILATVMSFSYSFIVLSLSAIKASGIVYCIGIFTNETFLKSSEFTKHGHSHGTSFGVLVGSNMLVHVTTYQKTLGVLQAIGNMCYSFLFTSILIEIQDTLSSSPPENKTMRKTLLIGIVYTTMFYMALGGTGYAAYGDKTPGNLLSALVSYRHVFWLVDLANLFIIVRLVGAYQVTAQPIFGFVEFHASIYFQRKIMPNEKQPSHAVLPLQKKSSLDHLTIFRIVWRTSFVILTTMISMAFPFFNSILGLLGALAYWPLTIYFPIQMHMKKFDVQPWSSKWVGLQILMLFFLLVSFSCIAGSIEGIRQSMKKHQAFQI
ncbi:hypothetical protein O6H91_13G080800 [Diphasiastrum complanatum]|uniref:Uncharacterized protein n=1 Tax=Diphasiastrum complanatum TaxID=34168 RepID=A0ACC2BWN5_DIPCM|nr:hypothetical protein O6H91_13G080800 [Diphasiastrum complanatum]